MKKILLILILILLGKIGFTQKNTIWVDSILTKLILNEMETFDKNLKPIISSKIELHKKEIVVNCQWTRPKYINNILQGSFDGVLVNSQITFDTSTNKKNKKYIDFKYPVFDKQGIYLNDTIAFTINREGASRKKYDFRQNDILMNTEWHIDKIVAQGIGIELDSCHKVFKLILKNDFTFVQKFESNQYSCSTLSMNEDKEVGVEGDYEEFMIYHDKIQGHYLNMKKGIWKIVKNDFLLIDIDDKQILSFEIEKLNNEELHLVLKKMNYQLKMKKTIH